MSALALDGRGRHAARRVALAMLGLVLGTGAASAGVPLPVPPEQRSRLDAERLGLHGAANLRTRYWNFGMVGDYPADPGNVNLAEFHSVEVPKGSGMNYSDGITPFVLAKIRTADNRDVYLMETGFRERQQLSPARNRIMRFEPRPGYFQAKPDSNIARAPAISNDPRTWPNRWPDKLDDPDDYGWAGSWNGYFGKRPAADEESFSVMDDDFYDAWLYYPDARDSSRHGLGLRVEVRGFQWANPQAGNVIFWHYDITNESTTNYEDNIIFGLYMDSGVGGSALSCDGVGLYESDDDNAFFDKSLGLNLVYTWDRYGHGRDLDSNCSPTGYLGYAYLETPGNSFDAIDNDDDGIRDEKRDGGPGTQIIGQPAIRAWVTANYDLTKFETAYGPLERHAPYRQGSWWTGDEDMDWNQEFQDVGADGVPNTGDTGEGDGMPSEGEPGFDRTDLNESDQIGLTGFKLNRIKAGQGNPDPETDGILFYTDSQLWPSRLYQKFTDPYAPARFDSALASNYNIGFLFASGPFKLLAGQRERFSLALAYGQDLDELRNTVATVQQIYNSNYQFAVPPPAPTVTAEAGSGSITPTYDGPYVRLSWDDAAERGIDPVDGIVDFQGYRIYRATDPDFRDLEVITTARGTDIGLRKPNVILDLVDGRRGYAQKQVEGVQYFLGTDAGITHTWIDTTVTAGQTYYYAVTAYDYGRESEAEEERVFPSENSYSVTRTPRGGVLVPRNVVQVRPNPRVLGYQGPQVGELSHTVGRGVGTVALDIVNRDLIGDGHLMKLGFVAPAPESIRAERWVLVDSTTKLAGGDTACITHGTDFAATGTGSVGCGLLPLVTTIPAPRVNTTRSGFLPGSTTSVRLSVAYQPVLSPNLRRPGYPDSITVVFEDTVVDTGLAIGAGYQARRAKFRVYAHTVQGRIQMDFRFRDFGSFDGTLTDASESFDIFTYAPFAPTQPQPTWRVSIQSLGSPVRLPAAGDTFAVSLDLPFQNGETFLFRTRGASVDPSVARAQFAEPPYVVPNPYVESASFEAARYLESGRGERRMEFRGLPSRATIRIYSVRGHLVQTLRHDGSNAGFVAWNLRTKDNLEAAPGLYVFHVEGPGVGTSIGKFAIIK